MLRQALSLGREIRIGFEDTLELPDGRVASSNAELVAAAARLKNQAGVSEAASD